jgi:hypothetical protein
LVTAAVTCGHISPEAKQTFDLRLDGFKKGETQFSQVQRAMENLKHVSDEALDAAAEVQIWRLLLDGTEEPQGPESDGTLQQGQRECPLGGAVRAD